jgi:hypothetical protein
MIAKQLEVTLGTELNVGEAEMVQRFQNLRDARMLPVSRGRNAEDITVDAIVSGLLSIVAERPAFAAQVVNMLRHLRPVGGSANAFAGANTLGQALFAVLNDEATLDTVKEIRLSESEIYTNAHGRAAIFYTSDDEEFVTYYVPPTALSQLQPGMEDEHDPRAPIRSMIREIVVYPHALQRIMNEVREDEKHSRLIAGIGTTRTGS